MRHDRIPCAATGTLSVSWMRPFGGNWPPCFGSAGRAKATSPAIDWWINLMSKTAGSTLEAFLQMVPTVDITAELPRIAALIELPIHHKADDLRPPIDNHHNMLRLSRIKVELSNREAGQEHDGVSQEIQTAA